MDELIIKNENTGLKVQAKRLVAILWYEIVQNV